MTEVVFPVCCPREYFEQYLGLPPELVESLEKDGKIKVLEHGSTN